VQILRMALIFCSGIVISLIGSGIWGCALLNKLPVHLYERESQYCYDEGMKAFQGGDYSKALKLFETLSQEAKDESLCRRTLYALACIRLIQAKDPDEFNKAMISWDLWSRLAPMEKDDEDPRMLAPFLKRIASLKAENNKVYQKLLQAKENEIKALRHQIEALETIHREIQEKKKEVSSP
jgi:tetratricopeptide (TPR) repeat protein